MKTIFFMEFPINIDQQTLKLKSNLKTWGKLLAKSVAFIVLPAAVIIQKMTRMGGWGVGVCDKRRHVRWGSVK